MVTETRPAPEAAEVVETPAAETTLPKPETAEVTGTEAAPEIQRQEGKEGTAPAEPPDPLAAALEATKKAAREEVTEELRRESEARQAEEKAVAGLVWRENQRRTAYANRISQFDGEAATPIVNRILSLADETEARAFLKEVQSVFHAHHQDITELAKPEVWFELSRAYGDGMIKGVQDALPKDASKRLLDSVAKGEFKSSADLIKRVVTEAREGYVTVAKAEAEKALAIVNHENELVKAGRLAKAGTPGRTAAAELAVSGALTKEQAESLPIEVLRERKARQLASR